MSRERYGVAAAFEPEVNTSGSRWRRSVALVVFGGSAAYFLLTEHRAHTIQALPWILVALCPLVHVFMHRRHGGHSSSDHGADPGRGPQTGS